MPEPTVDHSPRARIDSIGQRFLHSPGNLSEDMQNTPLRGRVDISGSVGMLRKGERIVFTDHPSLAGNSFHAFNLLVGIMHADTYRNPFSNTPYRGIMDVYYPHIKDGKIATKTRIRMGAEDAQKVLKKTGEILGFSDDEIRALRKEYIVSATPVGEIPPALWVDPHDWTAIRTQRVKALEGKEKNYEIGDELVMESLNAGLLEWRGKPKDVPEVAKYNLEGLDSVVVEGIGDAARVRFPGRTPEEVDFDVRRLLIGLTHRETGYRNENEPVDSNIPPEEREWALNDVYYPLITAGQMMGVVKLRMGSEGADKVLQECGRALNAEKRIRGYQNWTIIGELPPF